MQAAVSTRYDCVHGGYDMPTITKEQIQAFRQFLNTHRSFIIAGHKEPDGDCISSCIVLAQIVQKSGKPFQLISAGPFKRPELKRYEQRFARTVQEPAAQELSGTGLIIADCSEIQRLGDMGCDFSRYDRFIIDHHKTSAAEGSAAIIYPDSPATAYLVQQLYEQLVGTPDAKTASLLFFGLAADTGFFRFLTENSADIFHAAARLTAQGASPRVIYDEMTSGKPYSTRKLLGLMLDRAERKLNGRVIITYETMEDTRTLGQEGRDSDSLYQLLLAVSGVEAVAFVRQETDRSCTVGLRSRDTLDVSAIAAKFGGGGHKNAAGLSTEGTIPVLVSRLLAEFEKSLQHAGTAT